MSRAANQAYARRPRKRFGAGGNDLKGIETTLVFDDVGTLVVWTMDRDRTALVSIQSSSSSPWKTTRMSTLMLDAWLRYVCAVLESLPLTPPPSSENKSAIRWIGRSWQWPSATPPRFWLGRHSRSKWTTTDLARWNQLLEETRRLVDVSNVKR